MIVRDFFENLQSSLKALVWPGTSNLVFGEAVYAVAEIRLKNLHRYHRPCCFIIPRGGVTYAENDQLFEQNFHIVTWVENHNDEFGEGILFGSGREAGTSRGAGIFDVDQVVINHLRSITTLNSRPITIKRQSQPKIVEVKDNEESAFRVFKCSVFLSYDPDRDPDEDDVLRAPGQLYFNPTNIPAGSYGNKLGFAEKGINVDPGFVVPSLTFMDEGITPQIDVYAGNDAIIIANLMSWNSTTIARLFPEMTTSDRANVPGSQLTGDFFSDSPPADGLVFVPDNTADNKVIFLPRAVPFLWKTFESSRTKNTVFQCIFKARRTGSDDLIYIGPAADAPVV